MWEGGEREMVQVEEQTILWEAAFGRRSEKVTLRMKTDYPRRRKGTSHQVGFLHCMRSKRGDADN